MKIRPSLEEIEKEIEYIKKLKGMLQTIIAGYDRSIETLEKQRGKLCGNI